MKGSGDWYWFWIGQVQRRYHVESTEFKQHWARMLPGWVTARYTACCWHFLDRSVVQWQHFGLVNGRLWIRIPAEHKNIPFIFRMCSSLGWKIHKPLPKTGHWKVHPTLQQLGLAWELALSTATTKLAEGSWGVIHTKTALTKLIIITLFFINRSAIAKN